MLLQEYLNESGLSQEAFAIRVGVTREYVNMLCRSNFRPSLRVARWIEHVSDGKVSVDALLKLPKRQLWHRVDHRRPENGESVVVKGEFEGIRDAIAKASTYKVKFFEGKKQIVGVTHWGKKKS